jgi:GT2 family glycosyltransferase
VAPAPPGLPGQPSQRGSEPSHPRPSQAENQHQIQLRTWCGEFELSEGGSLRGITSMTVRQTSARVLIRLHGEPMGYIAATPQSGGLSIPSLFEQAFDELGETIDEHLSKDGLDILREMPAESDLPAARPTCTNNEQPVGSFTAVVCTRNRAEILGDCLEKLAAVRYPDLDIVIVDNAPVDDSTQKVVEMFRARDPRFRYVVEPAPGLSFARNRGLAEARGTYVAFTDDDVAVDPGWLFGLARGFRRGPEVGCVTGLVCTADIASSAEAYFDARASSWSSRCAPEVFDLADRNTRDALYPYSAGIFGTGANFAVKRELLHQLGGFDEALGAGTKTRGGEDLDIFVRTLLSGQTISYEPSSVVWHHHRADNAALLKQMYGYGTGLSAFIFKLLLQRSTRRDVLMRAPYGFRRIVGIGSQTGRRLDPRIQPPRGALLREMCGFVAGPALYVRARRARSQHLANAPKDAVT